MKKLIWVLSLLVSLGSTGIAMACDNNEGGQGYRATSINYFPDYQSSYRDPRFYGWYRGHYYNRGAWNRFRHFRRERFEDRYRRDDDRNFGRQDDRNDGRFDIWNGDQGFDRD